jgi:argininosuccinate synthase
MPEKDQISKIVLAFSGGLDTSAILHWLKEQYHCEIVAFTADLGQPEEIESARAKAKALGVAEIYIDDLRERFVRDFVFPMFRANALYEGEYLLGTAIARPLIAQRLVEIARETGATAIAHGATAKGNDQLRFEAGVAALAPDLKVIAPWREWKFQGRQDLLDYCSAHDIPVDFERGARLPWSMDANMLHISYEGGELEDPDHTPPDDMWRWTLDPSKAASSEQTIDISFERGDPVAVDGKACAPAVLLGRLNELGAVHGIGRVDMVENRALGIKSRGCYETPGGTILARARRALESITMDREAMRLKEELMPRYADLIYGGAWFSPEREMLQGMIDKSQEFVEGNARVRLYRGSVMVVGRSSACSLYKAEAASFEGTGGDDTAVSYANAYIHGQTRRYHGLVQRTQLRDTKQRH